MTLTSSGEFCHPKDAADELGRKLRVGAATLPEGGVVSLNMLIGADSARRIAQRLDGGAPADLALEGALAQARSDRRKLRETIAMPHLQRNEIAAREAAFWTGISRALVVSVIVWGVLRLLVPA